MSVSKPWSSYIYTLLTIFNTTNHGYWTHDYGVAQETTMPNLCNWPTREVSDWYDVVYFELEPSLFYFLFHQKCLISMKILLRTYYTFQLYSQPMWDFVYIPNNCKVSYGLPLFVFLSTLTIDDRVSWDADFASLYPLLTEKILDMVYASHVLNLVRIPIYYFCVADIIENLS